MNFYTSLIADSKITTITRYGKNEAGEEGSVTHATFSLKGQEFMSIDSNINMISHLLRPFPFTLRAILTQSYNFMKS